MISRKGGEEFTVLLIDCKLAQAKVIADRIRETVEQYNFATDNNKTIKITISIGISSFPETTMDDEKLIEQADIALYNAKRLGRNTVIIA